MKKVIWFLTIFLFLGPSLSCSKEKPAAKSPPPNAATNIQAAAPQAPQAPKPNPAQANEVAAVETNQGKIVIRFFPDAAPNHVANFKELSRSGFYNGTTFHRIIPGFMIQGGDPLSKDGDRNNDGRGGSGKNIKAEFNDRPHNRGTVSMARSGHPDSASSQFFICVAPATHLNGQYTAFGEVVEGMDVVDKIVRLKRDSRDNPTTPAIMERITITEMDLDNVQEK